VAASASKAALRAWTKGSLRDRVKAAMRTFIRVYFSGQHLHYHLIKSLTFGPRLRAILPRQIVVLVRIPGCSSLDVFASCFNSSPLRTRSFNLLMTVNTALTVCSRTNGARSVKPVTYANQQKRKRREGSEATNHLREDLVINNFLWQVVDHDVQIVK
jgi:hypothetical protein